MRSRLLFATGLRERVGPCHAPGWPETGGRGGRGAMHPELTRFSGAGCCPYKPERYTMSVGSVLAPVMNPAPLAVAMDAETSHVLEPRARERVWRGSHERVIRCVFF